jgi:hypothetical protein
MVLPDEEELRAPDYLTVHESQSYVLSHHPVGYTMIGLALTCWYTHVDVGPIGTTLQELSTVVVVASSEWVF